MNTYFQNDVLPAFKSTVDQMTEPLEMQNAKKAGQCFIANNINAGLVTNRGEVYEFFEQIESFAEMQKLIYAGQMSQVDVMKLNNMENLAKGGSWAIQHDGFDFVKYQPVDKWGHDIEMQVGMNPCGGNK